MFFSLRDGRQSSTWNLDVHISEEEEKCLIFLCLCVVGFTESHLHKKHYIFPHLKSTCESSMWNFDEFTFPGKVFASEGVKHDAYYIAWSVCTYVY